MTDMSAFIQKPGLAGVAPVYTQCTAADKFAAAPNSKYLLHYKCLATPTGAGAFKVVDQTTQTPAGVAIVANAFDAVIQSAGMLANTELINIVDPTTRFRDGQGFVNLTHTGTLTTVSVCIEGPFS
jgi:hypothetical protein